MAKLNLIRNERGFAFVEVLVAIVLLGAIAAVYLGAESTVYKSVSSASQEATAIMKAQSQMATIMGGAFISGTTNYGFSPATDSNGYTTSVAVVQWTGTNSDAQNVTVTVQRNGTNLVTLTDCKINRTY